jgi:hypothetical protein
MGLDENRGDMTLFPLKGDDEDLRMTRRKLQGLRLGISKECPYVFQEFIPGQGEWTRLRVRSVLCAGIVVEQGLPGMGARQEVDWSGAGSWTLFRHPRFTTRL